MIFKFLIMQIGELFTFALLLEKSCICGSISIYLFSKCSFHRTVVFPKQVPCPLIVFKCHLYIVGLQEVCSLLRNTYYMAHY